NTANLNPVAIRLGKKLGNLVSAKEVARRNAFASFAVEALVRRKHTSAESQATQKAAIKERIQTKVKAYYQCFNKTIHTYSLLHTQNITHMFNLASGLNFNEDKEPTPVTFDPKFTMDKIVKDQDIIDKNDTLMGSLEQLSGVQKLPILENPAKAAMDVSGSVTGLLVVTKKLSAADPEV
ncbi:hypothetical protein H0H93_008741, partial [Arthromyces matolae]